MRLLSTRLQLAALSAAAGFAGRLVVVEILRGAVTERHDRPAELTAFTATV
jgi:hypothetical protein